MAAQLLANIVQKFTDNNGLPLVGGLVYSYAAGTTTPQATFTDASAVMPNANPVVLDSSGSGNIWLTNIGYKFIVKDSLGNTLRTVDNVYIITPGSIGATELGALVVGNGQLGLLSVATGNVQDSAITPPKLANNSVIASKVPDGGLPITKLDPASDFTTFTKMIEVVYRNRYDLTGMRIEAIPQYPWTAPSILGNPTTIPAGQGQGIDFSPCGTFMAVCNSITPFLRIYERSGVNFNILPDPGTLPTGTPTSIKFSPNGDYLAIAHTSSPFLTIYQRQGNIFTKLANPATLPAGAGQKLSWSPNGDFLCVTHAITNFFKMYQITGTTFTDISATCGISGGGGVNACIAWSPDSQFLAMGTSAGSLVAFIRFGSQFSSITAPTGLTGLLITECAWSPDQQVFVAGISGSPYINTYSFSSGGIFGSPVVPASPPITNVSGISFSLNGVYLAVALTSSPNILVYSRSGTTLTLLTAPANLPLSAGTGVAWSPTNAFLALATFSTPFVNIYQSGTTAFPTNSLTWVRNLSVI